MEHRDSSSSSRSNGSNGRRNWKGNAAATTRPTPRQSSFPFGLHATLRGGGVKEAAELFTVGGGESKLNLCCFQFNCNFFCVYYICAALRCLRFNFINLSCVYCVKHLPSHGVAILHCPPPSACHSCPLAVKFWT